MSRHNVVSAWNHAEDVLAVIPLTTNVCITVTRHSASSTSYTAYSYVSTICEVTSSNVLGRNSGGHGEVVLYTQRVKIAL